MPRKLGLLQTNPLRAQGKAADLGLQPTLIQTRDGRGAKVITGRPPPPHPAPHP